MKEGFKDAPATCYDSLQLDSTLHAARGVLLASHQEAVNVGLLDQIRALVDGSSPNGSSSATCASCASGQNSSV